MMIIYLCVSASKAHAYNAFDNTVGRLSSDNVYYNCLGPSWKYIYIYIHNNTMAMTTIEADGGAGGRTHTRSTTRSTVVRYRQWLRQVI